jgi:hypothetical protein
VLRKPGQRTLGPNCQVDFISGPLLDHGRSITSRRSRWGVDSFICVAPDITKAPPVSYQRTLPYLDPSPGPKKNPLSPFAISLHSISYSQESG